MAPTRQHVVEDLRNFGAEAEVRDCLALFRENSILTTMAPSSLDSLACGVVIRIHRASLCASMAWEFVNGTLGFR